MDFFTNLFKNPHKRITYQSESICVNHGNRFCLQTNDSYEPVTNHSSWLIHANSVDWFMKKKWLWWVGSFKELFKGTLNLTSNKFDTNDSVCPNRSDSQVCSLHELFKKLNLPVWISLTEMHKSIKNNWFLSAISFKESFSRMYQLMTYNFEFLHKRICVKIYVCNFFWTVYTTWLIIQSWIVATYFGR